MNILSLDNDVEVNGDINITSLESMYSIDVIVAPLTSQLFELMTSVIVGYDIV